MLAVEAAAVGTERAQEVLHLLVEMVHLPAQMQFRVQLIVAVAAVVPEAILLAQVEVQVAKAL
jgi:hypothetical protein